VGELKQTFTRERGNVDKGKRAVAPHSEDYGEGWQRSGRTTKTEDCKTVHKSSQQKEGIRDREK